MLQRLRDQYCNVRSYLLVRGKGGPSAVIYHGRVTGKSNKWVVGTVAARENDTVSWTVP